MTLRELRSQVTLDGKIRIKVYDDAHNCYTVDETMSYQSIRKYENREVKFIYPGDSKHFVIELEEEQHGN